MHILDGPHFMNTLDYSAALTNLNTELTYSFKVYYSASLKPLMAFRNFVTFNLHRSVPEHQ